jgi:hypothetical protein
MRITIDSTDKVVELNGIPARIWEGQTDSGIPVHCFITRLAVSKDADNTQFEKELQEHRPPRELQIRAYPLRMIL